MIFKSYASQLLPITSNLQHIDVEVNIPELYPLPITIRSVYILPSHNTHSHDICSLFQSFSSSYIICGDFNAHSPAWGVPSNTSFQTNARGNITDQIFTHNSNLHLLNAPSTPTHLNSTSMSPFRNRSYTLLSSTSALLIMGSNFHPHHDSNLHLLNTPGTSTHLNSTSSPLSLIGLTLSSRQLALFLSWATHPNLCDSLRHAG